MSMFRRSRRIFLRTACNIDMFLLRFRIFPEVMFFARTAKNQRSGGNRGGRLANTKVHSGRKLLGQVRFAQDESTGVSCS